MVQRAADKLRHDLRPLLEFLVLRRIAGDVLLRQVFVLLSLRDLARRQMVVIVVNRLVFRILMKQRPRCLIFQQEIPAHKCFHSQPSNFSRLIHSPSAGFGM